MPLLSGQLAEAVCSNVEGQMLALLTCNAMYSTETKSSHKHAEQIGMTLT